MPKTVVDPRDKSRTRVIGLHFEPAEGGLLSRTHSRTSHSGKGGGPLEESSESGPVIHRTLGAAKKHLEAVFREHMAQKVADANDGEYADDAEG